jgi:hypothetical protein
MRANNSIVTIQGEFFECAILLPMRLLLNVKGALINERENKLL